MRVRPRVGWRAQPGWLLALALGGCAVGPTYQRPDVHPPSRFIATPAPVAAFDMNHWWLALHDAELDSLMTRAVRSSPDVQIALAHLQEIRAQESLYLSEALPDIDASAAGGGGTGSDLSRAGAAAPLRAADNKGSLNQVRQVAGFSASWELDLFGRLRRLAEAGRDDVQAAAAARALSITSVEAQVARSYLTLRGLQSRLAILQSDIATARAARDLQQARVSRGIVNELDLRLAERELASLRSQAPELESQQSAAEYALAALLGSYPEQLEVELGTPAALPMPPTQLAPGLPVDLLRRRPDVWQAERQLAAATARIGVATANLFPTVTLTGALGSQAGSVGLQGQRIYGFGPSFYWPLLDFGALDAQVHVADYRARAQLIAYKKSVIDAVRDTDSAIADFDAQQARVSALNEALSASSRAVELAWQRYNRGLTDFLNVDDAQRQQYSIQEQVTQAREDAALAYVRLCQTLGGGWEPYQHVPALPPNRPAVVAGIRSLFDHQP